MKKIVISPSCLPVKSPISQGALVYLLLSHFNAPEWLMGACGLFFLLLCAVWLSILRNETHENVPGFGEVNK